MNSSAAQHPGIDTSDVGLCERSNEHNALSEATSCVNSGDCDSNSVLLEKLKTLAGQLQTRLEHIESGGEEQEVFGFRTELSPCLQRCVSRLALIVSDLEKFGSQFNSSACRKNPENEKAVRKRGSNSIIESTSLSEAEIQCSRGDEAIGGDHTFFLEILNMLASRLELNIDRIRGPDGEPNSVLLIARSIKHSASQCQLTELQIAAGELESAYSEPNNTERLNASAKDLCKEAQRIINTAERLNREGEP